MLVGGRNAFDLQRKDVNYTDIYQNYYSDISLSGPNSAENSRLQTNPPRSSIYSDAPLNSHSQIYSFPNAPKQTQLIHPRLVFKLSSWKKWASKAFQKTFRDSSLNVSSFKSKQSSSVSSLPVTSTSVQPPYHRRTASVRPLPTIPVHASLSHSQTAPRNLHKRRATNGGREMPMELKRVDQQKERLEEATSVKKLMEKDLQDILNLLNHYATTPPHDSTAALQTVDSKMESLSENFATLKDLAGQILSKTMKKTEPSASHTISSSSKLKDVKAESPISLGNNQENPALIAANSDDDLDNQTQINLKNGMSSSRTSSTSSMETLKELTHRLVHLTSARAAYKNKLKIKLMRKHFTSENGTNYIGPIPLGNKQDELERIKLTSSALGAIGKAAENSINENDGKKNTKEELHKDYIPTTIGGETFSGDVNPKTGEVNGPKGLEPTRYGNEWERNGRVYDF